ncbi:MAG: hypothetical protein E7478_00930 [Ruminococcaceae bacterium]|nr:hypothetical protein [Oscillospiraceae bacterium]
MDLLIDKDALDNASTKLNQQCEELRQLRTTLEASFDQLRKDWDSDAGKQFFERFQSDLLDNLDDYVHVFEYMSKNLSTASTMYDEVFREADALAQMEY